MACTYSLYICTEAPQLFYVDKVVIRPLFDELSSTFVERKIHLQQVYTRDLDQERPPFLNNVTREFAVNLSDTSKFKRP